jgi:hypothetical protein
MRYHEKFTMKQFSYGLPGLFLLPLKDKMKGSRTNLGSREDL